MSPERWRRVDEVFHRALDAPTGERTALLDAACAGDDALRHEVESLLRSDARAEEFLETPAEGAPVGTPADDGAGLAGGRVGRYRVLGLMGAGGMGTVYLGVRDDGQFRQRAAIKVIKRGMDTDEIVRRFRAERQTLANLNHPNICRLLDGGVTEDGRPYLVMEHIEGTRIDEYCDRERLDVRRRLELFRAVCAGVQYAHQNLVIHRDLKPGNILVSPDGTPKLLDFGIAKVLGSTFGDSATKTRPPTAPLHFLTPEYASPEQLRGETVTTAADVYSLGVVLYELLTGRRPYRATRGASSSRDLAVSEDAAVRPSQAVCRSRASEGRSDPADTGGTRTAEHLSGLRGETPERLRRRLAGDLDTIVLAALRKDPAGRYASVEQFSEDIRRHLEGLPVVARTDTWPYRAAKFAGRNRELVGATLGVLIVSLVGFAVSTWLYYRADAARGAESRAAAAARLSAAEADEARRGAEFRQYVAHVAAASLALRGFDVQDARRQLEQAPEGLRNWEWRHFSRRLDRSTGVLTPDPYRDPARPGPGMPGIRCLAMHPGGGRVAFGCNDWTARVWDVGGRREIARLTGHEGVVDAIAYSRDGAMLATGSTDRRIILWDGSTHEPVRELAGGAGHTDDIHDVCFGPDASRLASVSKDRTIRLWDTAAGTLLGTFEDHADRTSAVAFSPAGDRLASASWDGTVRVRDLGPGTGPPGEPLVLRHTGPVNDVCFGPVGVIGSACADGSVRVWDALTGEALEAFHGHAPGARSVAFGPDGTRLVSGSDDRTVRTWERSSSGPGSVLVGHGQLVADAAFSPDGSWIASCSADGSVRLWDARADEVTILREDVAWRTILAVSPEDNRIAFRAGATDPRTGSRIRLWSGTTRRIEGEIESPSNVSALAFSPDGTRLIAGAADGTIGLWDADARTPVGALHGHVGPVLTVAASADGRWIASGADGRVVRIWDARTLEQHAALEGHEERIRVVAFGPGQGQHALLASGSADGRVGLWSPENRSPVAMLDAAAGEIHALAWSPDAAWLGAGAADGSVLVWDMADAMHRRDWEPDRRLAAHTGIVYALSFSPDGSRLASASADSTIKLWAAPGVSPGRGPQRSAIGISWQEVATLHGHTRPVWSVAFTGDGADLVSTSSDYTIRIWDGGR